LNFLKNVKRNLTTLTVFLTFLLSRTAFAGGFKDSKYATGTLSLINDVTFWLTVIIVPAAAALAITIQALRKKYADGEGSTINDANKKMRVIIIAAIIGETSTTLVTLITGYYV
jgi:heme/copper-type cytochrome/quinol oxidase subunit 2